MSHNNVIKRKWTYRNYISEPQPPPSDILLVVEREVLSIARACGYDHDHRASSAVSIPGYPTLWAVERNYTTGFWYKVYRDHLLASWATPGFKKKTKWSRFEMRFEQPRFFDDFRHWCYRLKRHNRIITKTVRRGKEKSK